MLYHTGMNALSADNRAELRGLVRRFLYGVLARPETERHDDMPHGKEQS
jgi:hypothetical protein